jgi:tetratricopeptide (TPR) repeat protein
MSQASDGDLGELEQEEMARLYDTVRRALQYRRIPQAVQAAEELVQKHPESTTAHELMGDVLAAQGKRTQARDEYRRSLDLEPANADAERKWAEVMLRIGEADRTRDALQAGRFDEIRGASRKDATGAVMRSMFFPGLGQLYNGDYEKGIITVLVGLPLFGLALWGLVGLVAASFPRNPEPMSAFDTALAIVGMFGYGVLVVWSVWDAWQVGGREGGRSE